MAIGSEMVPIGSEIVAIGRAIGSEVDDIIGSVRLTFTHLSVLQQRETLPC